MVYNKDYTVRICRKETISAALPLQEHWLSLSNLDLLLPPLDVGVFFIYTKPPLELKQSFSSSFSSLVNVLKTSLAKSLVIYYPFAGEIVNNSMGEPELRCNNRGVEFIEAFGDAEIIELDFYDADQSFERKLVPKKKDGVLTIQATEMKCGGMVIGCTFDHRVADAYSFNMFLLSWSETSLGKPISTIPSFRRSLLSPRRPPHSEASLDRLYIPVSQLPPPTAPSSNIINRIYYVTAANINRLQQKAVSSQSTKLEAFTAYLWKLVGRAAGRKQRTHMGVVVDGRRRLGLLAMMDAYFGNVLSIPYASATDVEEMEMSEIAERVHTLVAEAAREEHFKGLVDWVEVRRPEAAVAKVYVEEGLSVVVSSGRGFPVGAVEFGWGKPLFGSYHFAWNGNAGYVMPMPSVKGNGDWMVYAHLSTELVGILEADGIFHPITAHYLGLK
ncbi:Shikimate O-hydroxycinnamoyltransferase [Dendrobium catenatum]|uniref:Shikimate O-hydroxycinnamoyltransferase n=1 Tax=Dendrobium catenatum TaxID=906689 RepID=A0A2I0XAL6_9ASPA|nr:Shikimate O-hydroxycinnamoyltransferase [Dendrobium catenatum]